ncbi:MAG TPA: formylglycine-generating enzyme family protein [Thioploca sp.]|nr:formylglycine-generating enzyme family protein [Thioploca sp.]
MKPVKLPKIARLWLLVATLITPLAGIAEPADITVDAIIPEGRFVMFYVTNFEEQDFHCAFIRVRATVKDSFDHIVALRTIIARNVTVRAGSIESQVEAGKKMIQVLENQFDKPRIVSLSDLTYRCKPKPQAAKPQTESESITPDKKVFRDRLTDGSDGPEMVWIPAGRFRMGDIQEDGGSDEQPVHQVSVARFAMGRYEVTVGEFRRFVNATGYKTDAEKAGACWVWVGDSSGKNWRNLGFPQTDNHPVVCVIWNDAVAYAEWLSQQTGQQYRLPTEAEWEYAARAGTSSNYWWGNDIGSNKANCYKNYCGDHFKYTAPIGSFAANPFGLYDTVGNVCSFPCSKYEGKYNGKESECISQNSGSPRALRGGAWNNRPRYVRTASRNRSSHDYRSDDVGLRLARL